MIDRIFAAVLTFTVLIAATVAIGAAFLGLDRPAASAKSPRVVQLERVVVVVKRATAVARTEAEAGSAHIQ